MTLPEIIYCQQCYHEHRQTPASWAHPDPANAKRADFYCFPCLTREGIAVTACQSISAWRTAADNLPPGVSPKVRNVKFPAKPKRERPGRLDSERNSIVPNRAARPKVDHRQGNGAWDRRAVGVQAGRQPKSLPEAEKGKLPVRLEQRSRDNVVAVIREP